MSDKNVVKARSLPFDPPNSAAALHQFLSQYPNDAGVKLEGAFVAPVIKVRKLEPKKLDAQGREAWSFYLLNMQQRLAGTEHAQIARDAVVSLLKTEPLKLSVGKLLGPLKYLMDAEQERLSSANSFVKRWVAKEKLVLQIAVPHDGGEASSKKEIREREAVLTACSVLSRFSKGEDGDIDTARIRDEAYAIGRDLTREEVDALGLARFILLSKLDVLAGCIGPEVPLLISLCATASGKTESEFRADESTKRDVHNIMQALKARSDIDEYHTPTPPGTVAERKVRRLSMPVFAAPETTASTTSNANTTSTASNTPRRLTPEKEWAVTDSAPPVKSLPSTPRRELSGASQGGQSTPSSSSSSTSGISATHGRSDGRALNMGAAMVELKARQKIETGVTGDDAVATPGPNSPPVTPRSMSREPSLASSGMSTSSNAGSTRSPKTPSGRKRLDDASRADAIRQKSDGDDSLLRQPRRAKPPKRRVKSMESRSPDASDQLALDAARTAARTLNADLLKALTDTAVYKKWEAAEQQLHADLSPEASRAVGRLISYSHKVSLEQGEEQASLDRVIKMLRPQVKEARAFVMVRNMLLAESRGETGTKAASAFPELLSLLVFAIDAERKWRQEHDAKASH
nr:hypothetical protein [uncultured Noviherbaspirillum sp.]